MNSKAGKHSISRVRMAKFMATGAIIAFILITIFLFQVNNPDPAWGRYWMVRPMIIVPLAGAMGGLVFYLADYVCVSKGWTKAWGYLPGLVIYIVGLWLGFVLGLDGTLWD